MERDREVRLEVSTSNRSSCQVCKVKIEKDSIRVAHPSRSSNISVMKYVHPACYLSSCVHWENSKCKSTCRKSKHEIAKHALRLTMALPSCEGKLKDQVFFHPPVASTLVQQLLDATEGKHSIGLLCASLPEDARTWAHDALSGVDVTSRQVPSQEPAAKLRAPKKRVACDDDATESAEKPRSKKANAKSADDENDDQNDEESELVD